MLVSRSRLFPPAAADAQRKSPGPGPAALNARSAKRCSLLQMPGRGEGYSGRADFGARAVPVVSPGAGVWLSGDEGGGRGRVVAGGEPPGPAAARGLAGGSPPGGSGRPDVGQAGALRTTPGGLA